MSVLTKKLEKAGNFKFESVDGVKTSQSVAYVSADVANMGVLDEVFFKAQLDLAEKTLTLAAVPKYKQYLEGFDLDNVMERILANINEDTLFTSSSSGEGAVLLVHTPLTTQLKLAGDSPLGRAALLAAEMPSDMGSDIPELEADDLTGDQDLTMDA